MKRGALQSASLPVAGRVLSVFENSRFITDGSAAAWALNGAVPRLGLRAGVHLEGVSRPSATRIGRALLPYDWASSGSSMNA